MMIFTLFGLEVIKPVLLVPFALLMDGVGELAEGVEVEGFDGAGEALDLDDLLEVLDFGELVQTVEVAHVDAELAHVHLE